MLCLGISWNAVPYTKTCLCKIPSPESTSLAVPLVYFVVLGKKLGGNVTLAVYPLELRVIL